MTAARNVYAQKKVVGNPDYPVRDNAEIDINQIAASLPPAPFGYKPATTTGLTFGYYGGEMWVDGVLTSISDSTILLTASATNYVEATRAGVVSKNTTGFTAGQIPLYEITTDTGSITVVNDRRISNIPVIGLLSLSVAGAAGDVTLTAAQARNDILNFTGALTGNRNVIVPTVPQIWTVYNNTTGAFALTVKTAAGAGIVVTQGARLLVICDGTSCYGFSYASTASPTFTGTVTIASAVISGGSITGITDLAIADGGTGQSTAAGAFTAIKQAASESATGVVELGSNAEAATATDTARVAPISAMKYHPGMAKAWLVFNGTGTPAILGSYGVTSITDNGTGNYTINFSVTFASVNYGILGFAQDDNADGGVIVSTWSTDTRTTTARQIHVSESTAGGAVDSPYVFLAFFGDLV
ncbi:hypothetical protein EBAPG3_010575 [Nitrosospira lacus]|uniref:Uncharacterized protein n=1 Tax=Nitrosospira lacus TaxID=1288494 RepID=A0A1W6SQV4_9PROT|nr:hypothetical protein [Nitrosospira lacus]ARO88187.1 hypothetical protein EBAPG3_010575 [Nitrosospira lacus]